MVEDYLDRLHQLERPPLRCKGARDQGLRVETVPLVHEWETTLRATTSAE